MLRKLFTLGGKARVVCALFTILIIACLVILCERLSILGVVITYSTAALPIVILFLPISAVFLLLFKVSKKV